MSHLCQLQLSAKWSPFRFVNTRVSLRFGKISIVLDLSINSVFFRTEVKRYYFVFFLFSFFILLVSSPSSFFFFSPLFLKDNFILLVPSRELCR